MSPQIEKHNGLASNDVKFVGNFAGECSVLLLLAIKFPFLFLIFLGSLTIRDRFPLSNLIALCPSLYICAQMYTVNQGFGTSAAKGAHVGLRYPTMQRETINKLIFTVP